MRIVIVEDEIMIREGMVKLIKTHTMHEIVGQAKNGEEGLVVIRETKPDLIITDIRMPVMDGLEMLGRLHEEHFQVYSVILSGYSEFDYAKQAIRYGVEDYLLKPLAAEDIQELLQRIEEKVLCEEQKMSGTLEQDTRDFLFAQEMTVTELEQKVEKLQLKKDVSYQIYLAYTGILTQQEEEDVLDKLRSFQETLPEGEVQFFWHKSEHFAGCIMQCTAGELTGKEGIRLFTKKVVVPYRIKSNHILWLYDEVKSALDLAGKALPIKKRSKECMGITDLDILSMEESYHILWSTFSYPSELSNELRNAVCREQNELIGKYSTEFMKYMRKETYQEQDIRQAYLKNIYLLTDTVRETDEETYRKIQNTDILSKCMEVMTLVEMEQNYKKCIALITNPERKKEDISNYTIKKAISFIREHYQEGITLEEVSHQLDITPEYLSTLFNREMKINFSTFLRKFRLSHAKRLLKGSELKVYEIAEQIGYSDAKYFAKVFKDEFGVSPGDYRVMD